MKDKVISKKMNEFIHSIHKNFLVIYKKGNIYYSIDNDIYIYKGLFDFKYGYKNNRMIIFIAKEYLDYILKIFRKNNVSYVLITVNYGYNKISLYEDSKNQYYRYYKKGKRMVKNECDIDKIINVLKNKRNINILKKVDDYLNGYHL